MSKAARKRETHSQFTLRIINQRRGHFETLADDAQLELWAAIREVQRLRLKVCDLKARAAQCFELAMQTDELSQRHEDED